MAAAVGIVFYARPLIASDDYTLTATINGKPERAKLPKPFPSGSYYIQLDEPTDRYNWFGLAFGRAFSPIGIYSSPFGFHYIHTDQDKGVVLTDGKMEDYWKVDFTSSGVIFRNASMQIELVK
jgi:hypothetical protein